jgi:dolichyl-phosphate-mannose-protein mannosyltransferase
LRQYTTQYVNIGDTIQSTPEPSPPAPLEEGQPDGPQGHVTPLQESHIVGLEERVEYRDQQGNLLNEEEVAALKRDGGVSFQTRYETQTRLVDVEGQQILQH